MKADVFVLTGRCGFDSLGTSASTNHDDVKTKMEQAYKSALNELDGNYEKSGTFCGDNDATIVTSGDWHEWVITTHSIELEPYLKFTLPNGVLIKAFQHVGVTEASRQEWKSIDINAVYPDGTSELLCAVDWEKGIGTRGLIYDNNYDEPICTHLYKMVDEFVPVLHEIDAANLASRISALHNGDSLRFYAEKDETGGSEFYGVTRIDVFDASHILINYYGGNSPYVIDVTAVEDEKQEIYDTLTKYFEYCGIEAPVYMVAEQKKGLVENV